MRNNATFQNAIGLLIEPLDPLFFRDGRPFEAASRGSTQFPTPQTLYGMIKYHAVRRTGLNGPDLHGLRENPGHEHYWVSQIAVRGPWLAKVESGVPADVYTPPPAHLVHRGKIEGELEKENLSLLNPLAPEIEVPGFHSELRPLWAADANGEDLKPLEGYYLTKAGLQQLLNGTPPDPEHLMPARDLLGYEERIGFGMDNQTQTTREGQLYSIRMLRLKQHIAFYAEIGMEGDGNADKLKELFAEPVVLPFGGEGRRVAVRRLEKEFEWPKAEVDPQADGFASLLITPVAWQPGERATNGLIRGRWCPPHPLGKLVSAAVGKPLAVSGWDIAGRTKEKQEDGSYRAAQIPRPTRFAVPVGSIYFWMNGKNAHPERVHDGPFQLAQFPLEKAAGWGFALKANWRWCRPV